MPTRMKTLEESAKIYFIPIVILIISAIYEFMVPINRDVSTFIYNENQYLFQRKNSL